MLRVLDQSILPLFLHTFNISFDIATSCDFISIAIPRGLLLLHQFTVPFLLHVQSCSYGSYRHIALYIGQLARELLLACAAPRLEMLHFAHG